MPIAVYKDFSGGLNTLAGPLVTDSGGQGFYFADDAQNFQMMPSGLLKFPGFQAVLNSPLPGVITGLFAYNNAGTAELIACSAGKIYKIAGGSATQLATGLTAGHNYQAIVTNNVLILMNGVDKPQVYNGTTCVAMTAVDTNSIWLDFRPQGCAEFRNRLFFWGDPSRPDQLLTPRPGSYDNFDDSQGSVDGLLVAPGFGGAITGVRPIRDDYLVIYKQNCIRRLSGSAPFGSPDAFQILHVSDELGCVAPGTIIQVGLDHYFLSQTGIKNIQQVYSQDNMAANDPTYAMQDVVSTWNFQDTAAIGASVMAYDQINNRLVLGVPGPNSTTNNLTYNYNVPTNTNEPRGTGINAAAICSFQGQIYTGDYNGQVYQHGAVNSYNGAVMPAFWRSKYVAHNGLGTLKAYRRLVIYAEADGFADLSADIIVQWSVLKRGVPQTRVQTESTASGGSEWDVGKWDQAVWSVGNGTVFELKNLGKGKAIQLQLTNNSGSQLPRIREIDLIYEDFGVAKG